MHIPEGFATSIPQSLLQDNRLTLQGRGLLCMMLSFDLHTWTFSVAGLAKIAGVGRDAIRSALKNIEDAGYLRREQTHDENGHFTAIHYYLYFVSQSPVSDFPTSVNPTPVEPTSVNPTVINKQDNNIPPIVPHKRARREAKKEPDWKPDRFADFWRAYPRGESKQAAINAWDRLKPDDELLEEMARGLMRQLKSEMWQEGIGIPYASTWLNQRRWEDKQKKLTPQCEDNGGLVEWL